MKLTKAFTFAFCASAALFALSCSKKDGSQSSSGARGAKDGKITLTVWESTNGPDEFIKQAGKIYSESHPNIEIKFVNVELGDAIGQIALDGPAGKGADIFAAPNDRLSSLVSGGHVLPTADSVSVKTHALSSCVKALTSEGVMYGYPVSAETYALFYNRALIKDDEVPRTWEELAKWATDFNAKNVQNGKYGFVMDVGSAYYTIIFTSANGNRLFGPDGTDRQHSYLNTPSSVRGMQFFQTLRPALNNVPADDMGTSTVDAAFQSGNAAMHITGLWNVVPFQKAGVDFGVVPLPSLPGDEVPAASFAGTRAMFVSAYSDHPNEANDFARFLMSDEMQKLRFELTGTLPSVNIKIESPFVGGFLNQLEYAFPMPSIPEMAMFWEAMNNASKNIWNGAEVKAELDACDAAIFSR